MVTIERRPRAGTQSICLCIALPGVRLLLLSSVGYANEDPGGIAYPRDPSQPELAPAPGRQSRRALLMHLRPVPPRRARLASSSG